MGVKEKLKRELGFMKKGAKVLPKVVGQKAKGWVKGQYEAAKERAILEKQIEAEAKKAEAEAYKEERIRLAKVQAQKRARSKAAGKGLLAQLGEAGERMSLSNLLGVPEGKQGSQSMDGAGSYIMSGLEQPKKKPTRVVEHHHYHHYPKKKRRH
jgi:uncharacterized protein YgiM (DUF1202 family)